MPWPANRARSRSSDSGLIPVTIVRREPGTACSTRHQAATADGVRLRLVLPDTLLPVQASAPTRWQIQGQQVLFDPIDQMRGKVAAVCRVRPRESAYSGPCVEDAPDLLVDFARGYRVSWGTSLGGAPAGQFEDNTRKWSGDHIVDPLLVPGVLFMNRPFQGAGARLLDLAPTILDALGVPKDPGMEGSPLLA